MIKLMFISSGDEYGFYRAKVTVADGETSDYVKMNYNTDAAVAVYPSNRACVEYSISSPADIDAGNGEWIKWPLGTVKSNAEDAIIGVISAVRLVSESGAATMEILSR